jgi:hypothetical protein
VSEKFAFTEIDLLEDHNDIREQLDKNGSLRNYLTTLIKLPQLHGFETTMLI